jgi:hypothetical protein
MKFKISALKEGRFKKEVIIQIPQEEVSKTGATQYEKARFIGEFINVSDAEREKHQKVLAELNEKSAQLDNDEDANFDDKNAIKKQIDELTTSFIEKYFVAFEKHPRYPFPFVDDNEKEIASTSENIAALLDIRLIREQVAEVYNDEVNKHQNQKTEKMIKLLGSNLKP